MRKLALTLLLAAYAIVCAGVRPAAAIAPFQAAFIKEYINNHKDKEFAKYVKTQAKCNICHQGKATPKNVYHNAYGKELVKLLDPKKDGRDQKKIQAALQKVAKMHTNPKDPKSPTYGELIAKSKLPGGDLKASQKELTDEAKKKAAEEHAKAEEEAKAEEAKTAEAAK
jgi:hypothetical protein